MVLSIKLDTLTARILKLSSGSQSRIEPTPFYKQEEARHQRFTAQFSSHMVCHGKTIWHQVIAVKNR